MKVGLAHMLVAPTTVAMSNHMEKSVEKSTFLRGTNKQLY